MGASSHRFPDPRFSFEQFFVSSTRHARWRPLGYLLVVVGYSLMLLQMAVLVFAIGAVFIGEYLASLLIIIAWFLFHQSLAIYRYGRKLVAPSGVEVLRKGGNFVLYLRAFRSDLVASSIPEFADDDPGPLDYFWPLLLALRLMTPRILFAPPRSEEEQIARAFSDSGRLITVGAPDDEVTELGGARVYLRDEAWHEGVTQLIRHANLVLLRVGTIPGEHNRLLTPTPPPEISLGIQSEVALAIRELSPERLVLLVAADDEEYESFRAITHGLFPRELPSYCAGAPSKGRVRSLIAFDMDWKPQLAAIERADTSAWRLVRYPIATAMREKMESLWNGAAEDSAIWSVIAGVGAFAVLLLMIVVGIQEAAIRLQYVPISPAELMVITSPGSPPVPLQVAKLPPHPLSRSDLGLINVYVVIDRNGHVSQVHATADSTSLSSFVENTVRTWWFVPVRRNGIRVRGYTHFTYLVQPVQPAWGWSQPVLNDKEKAASGGSLPFH